MPQLKHLILLICLTFSLPADDAKAQTLTLYVYPPARPYKWKHPHSLLVSTIRNYYFSSKQKPVRLIGHMIIELKRDTSVILTAIEADNIDELTKSIKKDKIGLGVFFKPVPGHLESRDELKAELEHRTQRSRSAFISFNINDAAYEYLKLYIDSFTLKGYDKLYNGLNSPRSGEGSGCTAYGMSFLELINAVDPEFTKHWAVKVNVPEKLIGDLDAKKRISIWRIFFSFRWGKNNAASRYLELYEPYLVYKWINKKHSSEEARPTGKHQPKMNGRAKGLVIDCLAAAPEYPMFVTKLLIPQPVSPVDPSILPPNL